jgi:fructokinase
MRIVSLGEILWDIFEDGRRFLGGAPLNFSINSTRLGHSVLLASAVGDDSLGSEALAQIRSAGLSTDSIGRSCEFPTGTAEVRLDSSGNTQYFIRRPAAFDTVGSEPNRLTSIVEGKTEWVYFGTLAQMEPRTERALIQILQDSPKAKRYYDVNLRNGHWNLALVERLSTFADVIKMNSVEAEILFRRKFGKRFSLKEFCRYWSARFSVQIMCVTLGSEGCAIFVEEKLTHFAGLTVEVADTVGAGDAFSAGFLHGLGAGWSLESVARFANAAGAVVASRPGATPDWSIVDCQSLLDCRQCEIPLDPPSVSRQISSSEDCG